MTGRGRGVRTPSPRVRGEGWGEGWFRLAVARRKYIGPCDELNIFKITDLTARIFIAMASEVLAQGRQASSSRNHPSPRPSPRVRGEGDGKPSRLVLSD